MQNDDKEVMIVLFLVVMAALVGIAIGSLVTSSFWKTDMVERGLAKYNATSAKWEWTEEAKSFKKKSEEE